jgi:mannosylglycoprotein endo-beta-mannosidase
MVKGVWERPTCASSPVQRWNNKMSSLRSHLSGWAKHESSILRKEKQRLSTIIDGLKALAEVRPLSKQETELKNQSNTEIASLLCEEELKWYQQSKSQFILQGDANTRYFHSVANGRHRKKHIHTLHQDEGIIEGQEYLKSYIMNYYKNLFRALEEGNFSMDEPRTDDIPQVSLEENAFLSTEYSEEEVKKVLFQMEHNKALGPDDFPAEFYQIF